MLEVWYERVHREPVEYADITYVSRRHSDFGQCTGAGSGTTGQAPFIRQDSTLTTFLNCLRVLLAEPLRDLRCMLDAGQPTNDFDLIVHAISRLRAER